MKKIEEHDSKMCEKTWMVKFVRWW